MTFQEYINSAWSIHQEAPKKLLHDLRDHFSLMKTPEDVNAMAQLVNHVSGEHLGDWIEGLHLLHLLKSNSLLTDYTMIDRFITSLTLCENALCSIEHYSHSDQVRILAMSAGALSSHNQVKRAAEYLERAHELAHNLEKSDPANRALAISSNNLASTLEEKEQLSKEEAHLMIQAAFVARKFWEMVGTWKEVERAEYRLARSFLKADILDKAFVHAENCLSIIAENNNDPLEAFFGHEVMALIEKAKRNQTGFEEFVAKMKTDFGGLRSEDQSWCGDILSAIEKKR